MNKDFTRMLAIIVMFMTVAYVSGCSSSSGGSKATSCTSNTQCSSGQICQSGSCVNTTTSIPSAPIKLTATAGNAQVTLSWSASSGATGCGISVGGNYFDNVFHRVILIQTLASVRVSVDGVALGTLTHTLTPPYQIILQNWTPSWKLGDGNSYWDYIAVANYHPPEPALTIGAEQNI